MMDTKKKDDIEYPRIHSKADLKEWLRYEDGLYSKNEEEIRYKLLYLIQASERAILHKHQRLLRKTEYYTNCGYKIRAFLFQVKLNKLQNRYALHIPINTCGKGLHLKHLGPILMNDKTRIGEDCVIHMNTAFVAGSKIEGAPHIGNRVHVFIGVTVVGGVQIANGITIGANAVVNKNFFEEEIVIAGVPAKKIKLG